MANLLAAIQAEADWQLWRFMQCGVNRPANDNLLARRWFWAMYHA